MVSADYLPNIGGLAAHVYYLSRALQRSGHDVFVVNPVTGSKNGVEEVKDTDVPTFRIHFPKSKSKAARIPSRSVAIVRGLNQVFEIAGRPDVLHQHDHRFSTFAMQWISRGIPWVWTNHTSTFLHDYDRSQLRRWVIKSIYRGVDGIIAVSNELHDKSHALWERNTDIKYIPNGVNVAKFSPNQKANRAHFELSEDDFVVLCPRRIVPKNGVIYMVEAANRLVEQYPDVKWKFVFLGGDSTGNPKKDAYAEKVRVTASKECLQGYVSFMGDLPMEDMPNINTCADLIVMPSLMEAVSLSALEGMATQRPIVATNVGGLPQIVHHEETGLLVPPRNPEALASSIYRLYCDRELRRETARAARELVVEQYSWEAIARTTLTFYRNILSHDKVHA
jgi:hypothetical protein